jgi:ABC-type multidrug transport system fused ATPase/permease subunit
VRGADEIAVIASGRVAERGTHEELMKLENGIYARLYSLQFREGEGDTATLSQTIGF